MKCASEMRRRFTIHRSWKAKNVYWKAKSCKNVFSLELLQIRECRLLLRRSGFCALTPSDARNEFINQFNSPSPKMVSKSFAFIFFLTNFLAIFDLSHATHIYKCSNKKLYIDKHFSFRLRHLILAAEAKRNANNKKLENFHEPFQRLCRLRMNFVAVFINS